MELIYHLNKQGNFGDDLNSWIWEKYFPGLFDGDTDVAFIGIGTLLGTGAIRATPFAKKRVVRDISQWLITIRLFQCGLYILDAASIIYLLII